MAKPPELPAPQAVRAFREAQSRANNVAHDLGDLEWIEQSNQQIHVRLIEIQREAAHLVRQLQTLTGYHELPQARDDIDPDKPYVPEAQ